MHIVFVHIRVKEYTIDAFIKETLDNARNSINEPGVIRFDFFQQAEDPTRFTLVEVYKTPEDQNKHRETAHYNRWKNAVVGMMAEPRQGVRYVNLYPEDAGWKK